MTIGSSGLMSDISLICQGIIIEMKARHKRVDGRT